VRGRSDLVAVLSTAAAGEGCEMSHRQGEKRRMDVAEGEAEVSSGQPAAGGVRARPSPAARGREGR
jgi:hypothetical protein